MQIKIEIDEELQPALQYHLETGIAMQEYIKCALAFFNFLKEVEDSGEKTIGYGDKSRFKSYNSEVSPNAYLRGQRL